MYKEFSEDLLYRSIFGLDEVFEILENHMALVEWGALESRHEISQKKNRIPNEIFEKNN